MGLASTLAFVGALGLASTLAFVLTTVLGFSETTFVFEATASFIVFFKGASFTSSFCSVLALIVFVGSSKRSPLKIQTLIPIIP